MKQAHCSKCHRALRDPYSVLVGMGPECRGAARKGGVKFPKPKFSVRDGRVVFVGVEGKIELPTVDTDATQKIEKEKP